MMQSANQVSEFSITFTLSFALGTDNYKTVPRLAEIMRD